MLAVRLLLTLLTVLLLLLCSVAELLAAWVRTMTCKMVKIATFVACFPKCGTVIQRVVGATVIAVRATAVAIAVAVSVPTVTITVTIAVTTAIDTLVPAASTTIAVIVTTATTTIATTVVRKTIATAVARELVSIKVRLTRFTTAKRKCLVIRRYILLDAFTILQDQTKQVLVVRSTTDGSTQER